MKFTRWWIFSILSSVVIAMREDSDDSACFNVSLFDSYGNGWNGADYNILAQDGTIAANGTLEDGSSEIHEVCVVPACYTLIISSGSFPNGVGWSIGYGDEISGAAPEQVEFYVLANGHIVSGLCTTTMPSISPVPTTSLSPRTIIDSENCSGNGCAMSINLHTAPFAEYISFAYLTVDVQSPEYTVIAINEAEATLYGKYRDMSDCAELVRYIDYLDVTSEVRQNEEIIVSFTVPHILIDLLLCDDWLSDNGMVFKKVVVTLELLFSETSYLTLSPSVVLLAPTSTTLPPMTTVAPSISLMPKSQPTSAISTYNGLKSALESNTSLVFVDDIIIFPNAVSIDDGQVKIASDDRAATFDGLFMSSLLDLKNTSLTLEKLTLRRGYGLYFGCMRASLSQITIFNSSLVNCRAEISGGFVSLFSSTLFTIMSEFSLNKAVLGGVVYMNSSSTFTAVNSQFSINSAEVYGGVAYVVKSSTFEVINSQLDLNWAQDDGGVAFVDDLSTFKAIDSSFDSNSAEDNGGVAYVDDESTFAATDSNFDLNFVKQYGAVAFVRRSSNFTAVSSSFDSNSAEDAGGVVAITDSSTFRTTSSIFQSNLAEFGGVAVVLKASTFESTNSIFDTNLARYGGVAFVAESSTFTATNSTFISNSAVYGGVAVVLVASILNATNTSFDSNMAYSSGAVDVLKSSIFTATNSSFHSNSAVSFGGVALVSDGSNYTATDSIFKSNSANNGGVASVALSSSFTAINSDFTRNSVETFGGVADISNSSTFTAKSSSFDNNSAAEIGGVTSVQFSSTFTAKDSRFRSNSANLRGGAASILESSTFTATKSCFDSNTANLYGGVADVGFSSTLTATECKFNSNSANLSGGVIQVYVLSTFTAMDSTFFSNSVEESGAVARVIISSTLIMTSSSFDCNSAKLFGGVFLAGDSSIITATNSTFASNSAARYSGVAHINVKSTFATINSSFRSNSANLYGGVVTLYDTCTFTATDSSFNSNSAELSGGVALVTGSSKFAMINSTFDSNHASQGSGIYLRTSSFSEMTSLMLRNAENFIFCDGTGTLTAAHLDLDASHRHFVLDKSCLLTLYQVNKNGSEAFRGQLMEKVISESGTVNIIQYSYPCKSGQWSSDGIEHGNTSEYEDANGMTIDESDPFCDAGHVSTRIWSGAASCASRCSTCPAGRYLPFTIDRYRHIGVESCLECPVGRYLSDDGTTDNWWLHDGVEDCAACPSGRYGNETGMAECYLCSPGSYSADSGSLFCTTAQAGYFVADENATEEVPCPAGRYAAGSSNTECALCETGMYQPDVGQTSCISAQDGYIVANENATEELPCPAGRYAAGSSNTECSLCEPGSYQSEFGRTSCITAQAGYFVAVENATEELPCPVGRFAAGSSNTECTKCEPGTYQPDFGQTSCIYAQAGHFIADTAAAEEVPCPAGRYAAGSSNRDCSTCEIGRFQPDIGQPSCILSEPGYSVNIAAAINASACPPGSYSGTGADTCTPCEIGSFNNKWNQASCIRCDLPLTTSRSGLRYCDACVRGYYWDSLNWELRLVAERHDHCRECCVACEDLCDADDKKCVDCVNDGAVLEMLDVNRGWWRATQESVSVYECPLQKSCRGGTSVRTSEQCFEGHKGALCGACAENYDYGISRNRCTRCRGSRQLMKRMGSLVILLVVSTLIVILLLCCFGKNIYWRLGLIVLKDQARDDPDSVMELRVFEKMLQVVDERKQPEEMKAINNSSPQDSLRQSKVTIDYDNSEHDTQALVYCMSTSENQEEQCSESILDVEIHSESTRTEIIPENTSTVANDHVEIESVMTRRTFYKKILTKLKIVVAAWQIAAASDEILKQVRFPELYKKAATLFGMLGLQFLDVGSFKCLVGWTFFDRLTVVTLAPVGLICCGVVLYTFLQWCRSKLATAQGHRQHKAKLVYAILLFVYIIIPSISTESITYFSCRRFDRGNRADLKVVASQLDIKCTGNRYKFFGIYVVFMIIIWPIGFTLGLTVMLWRNRAHLNPPLMIDTDCRSFPTESEKRVDFGKEKRRHDIAMRELAKIKKRDEDDSISSLEFFFEEYRPRCFLFPVFELARRIFLASILAVFYPGSMQQIAIGTLGALVSMAVYFYFEAYIDDHDNCVASVAQWQVTVTYFASLTAFAAAEADQKQGFFSTTGFGVFLLLVLFSSFLTAVYLIMCVLSLEVESHCVNFLLYRRLDIFGREELTRYSKIF